jgi:hypothetical protein
MLTNLTAELIGSVGVRATGCGMDEQTMAHMIGNGYAVSTSLDPVATNVSERLAGIFLSDLPERDQ